MELRMYEGSKKDFHARSVLGLSLRGGFEGIKDDSFVIFGKGVSI